MYIWSFSVSHSWRGLVWLPRRSLRYGKDRFFFIFFWSSSCHEVILRATWTIFSLYTTGGPSSSCEMIILRNNSHGGIIRVCVGIFTAALRNKIIRQILKKNTSPYFYSVTLVIWPLTLMKRTHFSELSISTFSTFIRKAQGWTLHFRTPDPRSEKSKLRMTGRPQSQRRIQANIL